jgi:DNA-binding transcriptional MerR regulator
MKYTVQQLAKIAGITTRTLHYYDEIGLLQPSFVAHNGYRYYEEKELLKLQQILFFRELEFSLEEIMKIVTAPDFDAQAALLEQKKLLAIKKQKLEGLITTIDKTLEHMRGGDLMKNDDLFQDFADDEMNEYKEEAKKRWGHTEAYRQSIERTKHWTKADYKRIKEQAEVFNKELAAAMELDIKSKQVQDLIKKHHEGIEVFYDCSYEMYKTLGDMYVQDPRFTAYYDKYKPGLAKWLQKAITYYVDQHANNK